jgi:hypothetical protein
MLIFLSPTPVTIPAEEWTKETPAGHFLCPFFCGSAQAVTKKKES